MKKILFLFIVLGVSVWIGVSLKADPGYLLLSYHKWTVEMPLWFVVVSGLVLLVLIYYLVHMVHSTERFKGRLFYWYRDRKLTASKNWMSQGLIELAEGNAAQAEKYLLKALKHSDAPFANYVFAAEAAQAQQAYDRRDKYIRKAQFAHDDAYLALELTHVRLQIEGKQLEQALAKLQHLYTLSPKQPNIIRMLYQIYRELGDWDDLYALLPPMKRYKVFPADEMETIEREIYKGVLTHAANLKHGVGLMQLWSEFPRAVQRDPDRILQYAKLLLRFGEPALAEEVIHGILKKHWHEGLVKLYAFAIGNDPQSQLTFMEKWLKQYPDNAILLLTLGRLSIVNQLWGKARSYLENSVALQPTNENHVELAQLLETLGEPEEAIKYYKEGLLNYA